MMQEKGVEPTSLDDLLRRSDFVSLHLRLTDETRHFIRKAELAMMSPTSFLINTGRGGLVDEHALVDSLTAERIAGAGLDVLELEPPDLSNPLLAMDNVIITGHSAGGTVESIQDWLNEWMAIIDSYVSGHAIKNQVNQTERERAADVPIA